ncbi:MAG: peptidylprolyl isomerase [Cyclobacteriaceae bacterium]
MRALLLLSFLSILLSCSHDKNKFEDARARAIADWQDKRITDSLTLMLRSGSDDYRAAASLALASVQDTTANIALGDRLLEDPSEQVRINAAFALGQTGGVAAVNALIPALEDGSSRVVREVLEALGRTAKGADIEVLKNYQSDDTLTLQGLGWAYYRLGVRGLADSVISNRVSANLNSSAVTVRMAAAQYFARTRQPGKFAGDNLRTAATKDVAAEVRMAAARGLGHLPSSVAREALQLVISNDADYRVRCNALRALATFDEPDVEKLLIKALSDPDVNVRITISELIRPTIDAIPAIERAIEGESNWRVRANLYGVLLPSADDSLVYRKIVRDFQSASSDYEKAGLLHAMSKSKASLSFVKQQIDLSQAPVVRVAALQAVVSLNQREEFKTAVEVFLPIYQDAIKLGDPVLSGVAAGALMNPVLGYKQGIHDIGFLKEARAKLKLPEDIETIRPLDRAIAYFEGREPVAVNNEFNQPIDWELVRTIDRNQRVLITTTKGDIELQLFVEEAPGSVANFVQLVRDRYYDGKFVHRVVPNFVIQTGCKRGDGYGSEDYSIRSEFSRRRYRVGSVGMASAGKDTEGTQWFITHSATPHLDGSYTLFAEVTNGMDVVHAIEVGDKIIRIALLDN